MSKGADEADILIVDDDQRFHEFARRVVERLGYRSAHVRSGEEALRLLEIRPYRLLILDGLLPGIRGEEVARKTRERYGPEELPILFCSAFYRDMRSFRLLMNECGVSRILHKPVDEEQLLSVFKTLLEHQGEVREAPEPEETAELRAAYVSTSIERVESMERILQALGSEETPSLLEALRIEAHRFRGSGASFDLPEVSRLGGAIEDLLLSNGADSLSGPSMAKLEGLVGALRTSLRRAAGETPVSESRGFSSRPRILLVEEQDSPLAREVATLSAEGQTIWRSTRKDALRSVIELQVDTVFVSADDDSGIAGALPTLATLRTVTLAPLVLIARDSAVATRIRALEAGAKAIVGRPADSEALFRIATLYGKELVQRPVLLLGREGQVLTDIAEQMAYLGKAAVPCTNPERLFHALDDHEPSMVLVDADPDFEEAMVLVRLLRGDLRHLELPIVVATERSDRGTSSEAFASGATACISKPVSMLDLQPLLGSWPIQGWIRSKDLLGLDASTGLMGRERFEGALDRSIGLARRQGNVLSAIGFETGLSAIRRAVGGLRCEEIASAFAHHLTSTLRATDTVARWGRDRFLALLPGAKAQDAERIAREKIDWLVDFLATQGVSIRPASASVCFPDMRGSGSAFIERIRRGLDAALPEEYWEEDFHVEVDR